MTLVPFTSLARETRSEAASPRWPLRSAVDLALRRPAFLQEPLDAPDRLLRRHLENLADPTKGAFLLAKVLERSHAGERLDSPHPGRDPGLGEDLEESDVAGRPGVGAAAELRRDVSEGDHAHPVAVLLLEDRDGTGVDRLLVGELADLGRGVRFDPAIRQRLDPLDLALPRAACRG